MQKENDKYLNFKHLQICARIDISSSHSQTQLQQNYDILINMHMLLLA